jgi:hypothetical protein
VAGFADLVVSLVAVADSVTGTLQSTVTHYAFSGATVDAYNKPTSWGTGVSRQAVVERSSKLIRLATGDTVIASYKVTFPRPVAVDPKDRITLPGSVEGPILSVEGVVNPTTNEVYAVEVFMGDYNA